VRARDRALHAWWRTAARQPRRRRGPLPAALPARVPCARPSGTPSRD